MACPTWRTHLSSDETRSGASCISLNNLLLRDAAEAGVDLSRISQAHISVSEVHYYELFMLDHHRFVKRFLWNWASKTKSILLSPLSRRSDCFPFGPSCPHISWSGISRYSRSLTIPQCLALCHGRMTRCIVHFFIHIKVFQQWRCLRNIWCLTMPVPAVSLIALPLCLLCRRITHWSALPFYHIKVRS